MEGTLDDLELDHIFRSEIKFAGNTERITGDVIPEDGRGEDVEGIAVILVSADCDNLLTGADAVSSGLILDIEPVGRVEERSVSDGFVESLAPRISEAFEELTVGTEHDVLSGESGVIVICMAVNPVILPVYPCAEAEIEKILVILGGCRETYAGSDG